MGVEAFAGPPVTAEPGGLASGDWQVRNTGEEPVSVAIDVVGQPAEWSWVTPAVLTLPPGGSDVVRVSFRPPRAGTLRAGAMAYQLRLTSSVDSGEVTTAEGTVTVAPFTDVSAALESRSEEGRGEAEYPLTLANRGNAPVGVSVSVEDPTGDVEGQARPGQAVLEPGERATAMVTARPRRRLLAGRPRSHAFEVVVEPEGAPPLRLGAAFLHRPALNRRTADAAGVLLALAASGVAGLLATSSSPSSSPPVGGIEREERDIDPTCPGRGHLATEANGVRRAGPVPFSYSFLFLRPDGCTPVRFNPCEPIHYVTNEARATPDDLADLHEALRRVTDATGIEFVHDGPTDEVPGRRGPYVARYGARWAPVLIAWVGSDTIPGILGAGGGDRREPAGTTTTQPAPESITGAGVPIPVADVYVSGMLLINVDAVVPVTRARLSHGFGTGVTWGRVLMHELGHLLGLGHVASRTSIMQHELASQRLPNANWGIGDLAALRLLGREAGCVETPAFPGPGH